MVSRWIPALIVFLTMFLPQIANGQDCPDGTFGSNCTQQCHCLDNTQCLNGICLDHQCARGYKGAPYCNVTCPPLMFAEDCDLQCHCPVGNNCSSINGLCSSGSCDTDWWGPGCQTRLPKLSSPPTVDAGCKMLNVSFLQWNSNYDIGVLPIGQYVLQENINGISWTTKRIFTYANQTVMYQYMASGLQEVYSYSYRVISNRTEYGALVNGGISPASTPLSPICPTTTTTTSTTTTAPTTTTTTPTTTSTTTPTTTTTTQTITTTTTPPPTTTTTPTTTTPPTTSTTTSTTTTTPATTTTTPTTTTTTTPAPTVPDMVISPNVQVWGNNTVYVTWKEPDGNGANITSYNISYNIVGVGDCNTSYTGPITVNFVPANVTHYSVTSLVPWRMYRFYISAINVIGRGQVYQETISSMESAPTGSPQSVQLVEFTATVALFSWSPPNCGDRGGTSGYYFYILMLGNTTAAQNTTTNTVVTIPFLVPYSSYIFNVAYSNIVGLGPYSQSVVLKTSQAPPGSPRNLTVTNFTDTTLTVTWRDPLVTNGVIQSYQIFYKATGSNAESSVVKDATLPLQDTLAGLTSYTIYSIQVAARTQTVTNDGWGDRSSQTLQRTGEGVPSQPQNLVRVDRNSSCIAIAWTPPATTSGNIAGYWITYTEQASQSIQPPNPIPQNITTPGSTLKYTICGLHPAMNYRIAVQAKTSMNVWGPSIDMFSWTTVGKPKVPPRPVVVSISNTYVTLQLSPVVLDSGPTSGYFLVVNPEDGRKRKRRQALEDPTTAIPLPGYTTAFIPTVNVTTILLFVVGDGLMHGGYLNKPLKPSTQYNMYFVVASSLDGVTDYAFSQPNNLILTGDTTAIVTIIVTSPSSPTTTTARITTRGPNSTSTAYDSGVVLASSTSTPGLIAGLVIAVLLLILIAVFLILYCFWYKGRNKYTERSDEDSVKDLYKSQLEVDNRHSHWTDTCEMEEKRQPIILPSASYEPDDILVHDICKHHGRTHISFEEEYRHLPAGSHFATSEAKKLKNNDKNRFEHILPYDHSRVILNGLKGSDYINANFIHGFAIENKYIALTSPFDNATKADFWHMIFQYNVKQIVMVTCQMKEGITKCARYWPTDKPPWVKRYNNIEVRAKPVQHFANFVLREFYIEQNGHGKMVTQYQFLKWPDHGVPKDPIPFLDFRLKVIAESDTSLNAAPIVVHCGTGISQAAVYIAVDSLIEQAKIEHCVNVFKFCRKIRHCRMDMVRTLKEYIFIYDTLFEALLTNYNLVGDNLKVVYRQLNQKNPITDQSYFREQFHVLEFYTPELTDEECKTGIMDVNKKKNRFPEIVPPDEFKATLKTPGGLGRTDYVNALFVDSYFLEDAFIVTQTPLAETAVDFWKLVYDHKVSLIIMMNGDDFMEESCVQYWPSRQGRANFEPLYVKLEREENEEFFVIRTMKLSNAIKPSQEPRTVTQIQFNSWRMYEHVPWPKDAMLQLINKMEDLREGENSQSPVIVHCMDGASQSGLFVACATLCEKIREDESTDIFHTVKHIKRRRKQFVGTLEQYKFCFKMLWDYLNQHLEKKLEFGNDELDEPSPTLLRSLRTAMQDGVKTS